MRDISCCQPGKSCLSSFFFWGGDSGLDLCSLVIRQILGFRFGLFLMFLSLQLYIYTCHWPVPRAKALTANKELDLGTSLDPLQP